MTKREFYKFLKENGIFATFCISCSQAFKINNHRDRLNKYIETVAIKHCSRHPDMYAENIKMWKRGNYGVKVRIT
jgi:hypothetical protein